ncbi:MAG: HlyD family type I secretion periplasmic adaptor subunit [Acetobacterales bacterium]
MENPKRRSSRSYSIGPTLIAGAVGLTLLLGGLAAWGARAPLASAVIAPGVVKVSGNRKQVQHLQGGTVGELLVNDGDKVRAGDILIRLDGERARVSVTILQIKLDTVRALEARLRAERDRTPWVEFPADMLERAADTRLADTLAAQLSLFEARRESLSGQEALLLQQVDQLREEITGLESQRQAKQRQIGLITEETAGLRELHDKGFAPKTRLLALEREAASLEGERGEHIAAVARARKAIGETGMQAIQIRNEFREEVVNQLRDAQAEIFDLQERLAAAREQLYQLDIRTPVDGVVVGLQAHTIGGVIKAGETILEIVPSAQDLLVEARVQLTDIDNVAIGHEADVQFTAFKQRVTPVVTGRVSYVSADRIEDQASGQAYYIARVKMPAEEIDRLGDEQLQPGMPANVIIKTGERTALQYLVQPILDSMNMAWREE